jgi:chorismate lyase / 3-hydroxybenzoate synthase
MSALPLGETQPLPRLSIAYRHDPIERLLADRRLLAVIGFGSDAPLADDPRCLRVTLTPHGQPAPSEVWLSDRPVDGGREGDLQWAADGELLFGAIELDERAVDGVAAAAQQAYGCLLDFCTRAGYPHPQRLWNYIDAITDGDGGAERYRAFNIGRAAGIAGRLPQYPAATAIGRHDGRRTLQVYWLAAREPGRSIENPRQVSAFLYPRQYGPQSPSFARATLPADPALPLLVSGTASVVGHASAHDGQIDAQIDETLRNIDSVLGAARHERPTLAPALGPDSLIKAYVRDPADLPRVAALLDQRLPVGTPRLLLHGERQRCRRAPVRASQSRSSRPENQHPATGAGSAAGDATRAPRIASHSMIHSSPSSAGNSTVPATVRNSGKNSDVMLSAG